MGRPRSRFALVALGLGWPAIATGQSRVDVSQTDVAHQKDAMAPRRPRRDPPLPPSILPPSIPVLPLNVLKSTPTRMPIPPQRYEAPASRTSRWYGWQTAMVLIPADLLLALPIFRGLYTSNDSLVLGGVAALFPIHMLTGPMIHCMHGMCIRGLTAFANNWGVTGAIYLAGSLVGSIAGNETVVICATTLGFLAAQAIDIFEFSYEPRDKPMTERNGRRAWLPSSIGIVPVIEGNRQGVSIIGRF